MGNKLYSLKNKLGGIKLGKSPIKINDVIDVFMVEVYPINEIENPNIDENDENYGAYGYDEISIYVTPTKTGNYVTIERRIKLYNNQDEYQLRAKLEFDNIFVEPINQRNECQEASEMIGDFKNSEVFDKLNKAIPLSMIIEANIDCIG
jgi:hypothetical protein